MFPSRMEDLVLMHLVGFGNGRGEDRTTLWSYAIFAVIWSTWMERNLSVRIPFFQSSCCGKELSF